MGNSATYLARHCSDYARSSGGWVYFGDLVDKMHDDGYEHQTVALAAHGLAALQPGTVEVLGVLPDDLACIKETRVYEQWHDFKSWPLHMDERASCPVPVFYSARQGHSMFVASIERMYAPYDPGLARCRGPLLHIADMEALAGSMLGNIQFPKSTSGLCFESDYGLLRLLPTKRDPATQNPDHFPPG
eukprot:1823565-Pyramimonas_sp.AAC.1